MNTILITGSAALLAASLGACALPQMQLAPGAAQVRITSNLADVQTCRAVGNVDAVKYGGDEAIMRNDVIGDGGDTLLLTLDGGSVGRGGMGIAYRCAKN